MAAIWTNWGKAAMGSALLRGTTPAGAALPETWYFVLYDTTYTPNPDHATVSEVSGAMNPADYTGNSVARASASFGTTVNNSSDRGEHALAASFTLTAGAPLANAKGYMLCAANNLTTANIVWMQDFSGGALSVGSGQTLTVTGGAAYVT